MTETMNVYRSATSSTPVRTIEMRDLQETFPWVGVSTSRPADQAWFWTPDWQEGEREVDENIAAGHTAYFDSADEFLAALEREIS